MKINIDGVIYVVTENNDETYTVNGGGLFIIIQPFLNDTGVTWGLVSGDASLDLVAQIGELIEDHDM
jgi:hypothetical protein